MTATTSVPDPSCLQPEVHIRKTYHQANQEPDNNTPSGEAATFDSGCFYG